MLINSDGKEVVRDQQCGVVQLVQNLDDGELFYARVSVVSGQSESGGAGEPIHTTAGMQPRLHPRSSPPGVARMFGPAGAVDINPYGDFE